MRKNILLPLFGTALLISGFTDCAHVPNTNECAVLSIVADGMTCIETNTGKKTTLTLDDTIAFLEPQEATATSAKRAGAVCRSAADELALKNAVETMCRMLGSRCDYAKTMQYLQGVR